MLHQVREGSAYLCVRCSFSQTYLELIPQRRLQREAHIWHSCIRVGVQAGMPFLSCTLDGRQLLHCSQRPPLALITSLGSCSRLPYNLEQPEGYGFVSTPQARKCFATPRDLQFRRDTNIRVESCGYASSAGRKFRFLPTSANRFPDYHSAILHKAMC